MREAYIVSTARTPLAKSVRGAFNATHPVQLGAWSVEAAVKRAGLEGGEIDDVVIGVATQGGARDSTWDGRSPFAPGFPSKFPE